MTEDRLVFLDMETTGLDPDRDVILEVAALVVTPNLNVYPEKSRFHRYVQFLDSTEEVVLRMCAGDVRKMHRDSGLIAGSEHDRVIRPELVGGGHGAVESALLGWLVGPCGFRPGTAVLTGSGIHFDRNFIRKRMPRLEAFLHYRMLDVTSLREAYRRWADGQYEKPEPKHRAEDDIDSALAELRLFRSKMLSPKGDR